MDEQGKKIALITGANKGLGLETARQLGRMGITVLVGSRDLARGEAAAAGLKGEGIDAFALKLDVVEDADVRAAAGWIEERFGRLDILVNNAGVLLDQDRPHNRTSTTSQELLRETFETNFFAVVALTQALLPLLRKSAAGRVVNLVSILASLTYHATPGSPVYDSNTFAYDTSKTALNSFTVHLAHELRHTKIKVNSADPGWPKTEMGGPNATMEISEGARTPVELATLGEDGPTGGCFHAGEPVPW
ncbi:SDR family oxidoreductase [Granulicella sp. dw_53]|uniref:SDR family oxidoreductase n=1 Tax=Granulicella sp. dw_53 TaxID=2719792 RepID=UPI001BD24587|nr:SDR family oxidoreductase [Granulicella sp. dw_53]